MCRCRRSRRGTSTPVMSSVPGMCCRSRVRTGRGTCGITMCWTRSITDSTGSRSRWCSAALRQERRSPRRRLAMEAEFSDVLIIGAGISGIGAAYRIREKNPHLSYTILERRARLGGTWDLFRYPGIRSDSDIFTLCFPWEPWTRPEMIVDGEHIWEYLDQTTREYGIHEHIRFNTYVRSADWDSVTDTWRVYTEQDGKPKTYRCRFLFFATGYYDYDKPYHPPIPGIEDF